MRSTISALFFGAVGPVVQLVDDAEDKDDDDLLWLLATSFKLAELSAVVVDERAIVNRCNNKLNLCTG